MPLPEPEQLRVRLAEKRLPPFAALRAFEAVVRLGGIRKAAQSLDLHHSVVSRHLTQLESWLGIPLLQWSGKRFSLTGDGERYHGQISAGIAQIAVATAEVLDHRAAKPLKVWCSQGLSIQWLAGQIPDFEKQQPEFTIDLRPSDVPANLLVHEADVNIFMHLDAEIEHGVGNGLKASVLARPAAMIAASPDLARELSWIASASDLLKVPLLHGRHTMDWRCWLSSNGVDVPEELPGELCWHPHMSLEATRLGRGVLLAKRFFLERDLARGELVELKVPGTTDRPFGGYLFVAREDRWSMPGISALRQFLAERMKVMEPA